MWVKLGCGHPVSSQEAGEFAIQREGLRLGFLSVFILSNEIGHEIESVGMIVVEGLIMAPGWFDGWRVLPQEIATSPMSTTSPQQR
tara:strand:- start:185 stop:442 length:258 start_codon:yes stop_codon:yes gene_type:complete